MPEDEALLMRARASAEQLIAADPRLEQPEHALLADRARRAHGEIAAHPIARDARPARRAGGPRQCA